MRITFVARRWWPAMGGGETFARHLARGLADRHEVTVLAHRVDHGPTTRLTDSLRQPPAFKPFDDGPVRVVPMRIPPVRQPALSPLVAHVVPGLRRYAYGRSRAAAGRLYARVVGPVIAPHAAGADVVHMWGSDLMAAASVRGARLAGRPIAITPLAHEGQWGDDRVSAGAYRDADAIVALLNTDADVYRRLGAPAQRVEVCGVCSPGVPSGGGAELRKRLGIDGPLVLFLGVRRPYKGYDVLAAAVPRVVAARSDVTFAFVGPGDPIPTDGPGRVIDAGEADDTERAAWLDAADLLCLPSAGEIFPVSILEAWSVGTPVLTSDIPTLRELIERSGGGATASRDPAAIADAILALLAEPERLRALGESGQMFWNAHHTVDAVTRWHEQLYERLIDQGAAR
jgi:glycosyltransferase involved in cell wall biosynthesis